MFRTLEASSSELRQKCRLGLVHVCSPTRDDFVIDSTPNSHLHLLHSFICTCAFSVTPAGRVTRLPPPDCDVAVFVDGWVVGNGLQRVSVSHARS